MDTDLSYGLQLVKPIHAVNDWTLDRSCPLTPCERSVLRAIAHHADYETGTGAYPSLKTIAAESGVSRATVCRALAKLEQVADLGYPIRLIRERRYLNGQYTSNLYSVQVANDSLMRLPSLTVRRQDLHLLTDPDPEETTEPETEPEAGSSEVVVEQANSSYGETAPISPSRPLPPARKIKPPRPEQAQRMLELARLRERLVRERVIVFPWQQRPVAPLSETPLLQLDYAPRDAMAGPIGAPIRAGRMPDDEMRMHLDGIEALLRACG